MNRLIRGFGALVAIVGIVVGVPWVLLRHGDWPITAAPTTDWLRSLQEKAVTDSAIFAVLTVAAWLIWAVFTIAIVTELASALRGVRPPRLTFAGPIQRSARVLVAALVLAVSINQSVSRLAAISPAGAMPATRQPVATQVAQSDPLAPIRPNLIERPVVRAASIPTRSSQSPPMTESGGTPVVVVKRGDSAWGLAEQHLGDGMRWKDLWKANCDIQQADGRKWSDPNKLMTGWLLQLPGADPAHAAAASGEATPAHTYVVARGDTLSEIAQDELGSARRYPEIFEASRDVEQPGGRQLKDPNLILPGWTLVIPGDDEIEPTRTPPAVPDIAPAPTVPEPEPLAPSTTHVPPTTAAAPSTSSAPSTTLPTSAPPSTAAPTSPPTTWPAPSTSVVDKSGSSRGGQGSLIAALGGSLVLASALSIRMARLRRLRSDRGIRDRKLIEANGASIRSVVRAADVPLVKWAAHELAQLVLRLDRRSVTGAPEAVELSEDCGIEILWETEQPAPPEPWIARDGGWAWRLAYDPDRPTPAADRSSPFPALVTIGQRDGRQLLLDLEAFGTVSVVGPDDRVDALLRSIAIELAAGNDIADAHVHVVGLDVGGIPLPRLRPSSADDAMKWIASFGSSVAASIERDDASTTFAARLGHPIPIEAHVVVAGRNVPLGKDGAAVRRGVAVVVGGEHPAAECTIRIEEDGSAKVDPLGVLFSVAGVGLEAAEVIADALDELTGLIADPLAEATGQLDLGAVEDLFIAPQAVIAPDPYLYNDVDDLDDGQSPPESIEARLPECIRPKLLVKVLGIPHVPSRPNLKRRHVIATVVLACHDRPIPIGTIQDSLYGDKPIEQKTLFNVIGLTRSLLGDFEDGTEVFPDHDRQKRVVGFNPGVRTDVQVLNDALKTVTSLSSAEAVTVLDAAHQLIEGIPFCADGYDWAHDELFVDEANNAIEQATVELVGRALENGLIDLARRAVTRAFRALKTNEALFRCRILVEHASGNPSGARAAYTELSGLLEEMGIEPSTTTKSVMGQLG